MAPRWESYSIPLFIHVSYQIPVDFFSFLPVFYSRPKSILGIKNQLAFHQKKEKGIDENNQKHLVPQPMCCDWFHHIICRTKISTCFLAILILCVCKIHNEFLTWYWTIIIHNYVRCFNFFVYYIINHIKIGIIKPSFKKIVQMTRLICHKIMSSVWFLPNSEEIGHYSLVPSNFNMVLCRIWTM